MVVLVAENEANIIVIDFRVNEESSLEIDAAKRVVSNSQPRVRVLRLYNLSAFVVNHPVRIDLRLAFGVKHDRLISAEVGRKYSRVVRAIVEVVGVLVTVVVLFAYVSDIVVVRVFLVGIINKSTVVALVENAVVVDVRITSVSSTVVYRRHKID